MRISAYEPCHDPAYGWVMVKCGNYRDALADGGSSLPNGQSERVGWFQDRPTGNNTLVYPRDYGASSVAREALPRIQMNPVFGGYQMFAGSAYRYLGFRQWASGDVDSPVLYPGKEDLLDYTQQANYYAYENSDYPLNPTQWDATRRIARRSMETPINSEGGQRDYRMAPWVAMSSTLQSPGEPSSEPGNFVTYRQMTEQTMMLRGKNVPEILFWTSPPRAPVVEDCGLPQYNQDGHDDCAAWTHLITAWSETPQWLSRVYAGRVNAYVRTTGLVGGSYSTYDTARLEFTLAEPSNPSNQEYEVEVPPKVQLVGPNRRYTTGLVVDFEWTNPDYYANTHFDVQIEGSCKIQNVIGDVYIWNGSTYQLLTNCVTGATSEYGIHAPQSSDGRYRFRQRFENVGAVNTIWLDPSDGKYKTRLKLVHTSAVIPPMEGFMSWYDLVQLTPDGVVPCNGGNLMAAPVSDANGDGVVDAEDLLDFADSWASGSAAADVNLSESLDTDDVSAFLEKYIAWE